MLAKWSVPGFWHPPDHCEPDLSFLGLHPYLMFKILTALIKDEIEVAMPDKAVR